MARNKQQPLTFDDVLGRLGTGSFDVSPAVEGAKLPNAYRVSKQGCAAEIARAADGSVEIIARPGILLNGHIARLVDRGYQKFFQTGTLEVAATADHLRTLHHFSEELKQATGGLELYNEALGTTSDKYLYDRVLGR